MTDKRYQVFLSSTFEDLKDERDAIIRGLLDVDCFPAGMEMFAASDESQWEMIKKYIDRSDYYIVVSAGRYGTIDEETGFSFTEKEYRYAIETKTPVAAFIRDEIDSLPQKFCEPSPERKAKLDDFHKLLRSGKVVSTWSNKDELRNQITLSINRLSKERDAVGWVRADRAPSGQVLQDLLDTKQKVEELEAQIQKYHEKSESLNPDFAWYADEVTLRGMIDDSANNTIAEFSFSYDWKTLFESIASVILNRDFVTRSNISDHICNMVFASEKTYLNKKKKPRLTIYPKSGYTKTQARDSELKRIMFVNSEHILIAQCVVHHLLEVSDKGIVTLTEFGLRHYYELSAIKRPPSTEMSKLPSDPPHQNLLPNT